MGYIVLLYIASVFSQSHTRKYDGSDYFPTVTVIVPVYNEERVIESRIENLLSMSYPRDKFEILVVSDGSTDRSVVRARQYADRGVSNVEFQKNRGRAAVHNDSVPMAKGELTIFTDADTIFDKDFITNIVLPFQDRNVGCAVGNLVYQSRDTPVSSSEKAYYNGFENRIKVLESRIGIFANGAGACMAIRKDLFKPLTGVDDVDTATVLDILFQGFKIAFVTEALAYDMPPTSVTTELNYRIRGTSKTIASLWSKVKLLRWFEYPMISWGIFSHRLLRYLSPYFLLALLGSSILLLHEGLIYQVVLATQAVFYGLGAVGGLRDRYGKIVPFASIAFSFCVAMIGMMIGVAKGALGRAPSAYKMADD
jgi:cellulose synthase/poly-beta-1,6-N-acetylglucosamine synthase-like glycosyltransferase